MDKQVYSLVLMDEVVREVDKVAYHSGLSRSAMINRILAEYVSCETPEKQIDNVFSALIGYLDREIQVMSKGSESLVLRSPLPYKYNPTARYSVALTPGADGCAGILKVSLKTQYQPLIAAMQDFFERYCTLEQKWLAGKLPQGAVLAQIEQGRLIRRLYPESLSATDLAKAINAYVARLDRLLKNYFGKGADYPLEADFVRTLSDIPIM
ncbi:MAG: hypothetical protein PHI27_09655 [Eubacteriales bacterium]|nr:hypothetical protein [Eubacteriales bacterium]MDD3882507.1 hypothetical protein [Eubacteriales bacterium]MDD4512807.1 hypothetical protein [Eubacteriales bacterium]